VRLAVHPNSNNESSQIVKPGDLERPAASRLQQERSVPSPAERTDWLKLWFALQRTPWRSLALVPAGNVSPDFTLEIAASLVQVGVMQRGPSIHIADGTQVPMSQLMQFMNELQAVQRRGDSVLIALGAAPDLDATVTLAHAADAALLCVPMGVGTVPEAKHLLSEIGPDRFVGSAVFHA
jgi:hypothetical protein